MGLADRVSYRGWLISNNRRYGIVKTNAVATELTRSYGKVRNTFLVQQE